MLLLYIAFMVVRVCAPGWLGTAESYVFNNRICERAGEILSAVGAIILLLPLLRGSPSGESRWKSAFRVIERRHQDRFGSRTYLFIESKDELPAYRFLIRDMKDDQIIEEARRNIEEASKRFSAERQVESNGDGVEEIFPEILASEGDELRMVIKKRAGPITSPYFTDTTPEDEMWADMYIWGGRYRKFVSLRYVLGNVTKADFEAVRGTIKEHNLGVESIKDNLRQFLRDEEATIERIQNYFEDADRRWNVFASVILAVGALLIVVPLLLH